MGMLLRAAVLSAIATTGWLTPTLGSAQESAPAPPAGAPPSATPVLPEGADPALPLPDGLPRSGPAPGMGRSDCDHSAPGIGV